MIILRDTHLKGSSNGHGGNRRTLQIHEIICQAGFSISDLQSLTEVQTFLKQSPIQKIYGLIRKFINLSKYLIHISPEFRKTLISIIKTESSIKVIQKYSNSNLLIWEDACNYLMPYMAKDKGLKTISLPQNLESIASSIYGRLDLSKTGENLKLLKNEIKHFSQTDYIFCISREEQWLLRLFGLKSDFLPYYPPEIILKDLLKIRKERELCHNESNIYDREINKLLILGSASNFPTKEGMLEIIDWLNELSKEKVFTAEIAGYGTDKLKAEISFAPQIKLLGTLSDQDLLAKMVETDAVLIHQKFGLGAITRIPEMLAAGIPVIVNNIAARSYYDCNGIYLYENRDELADLIGKKLCVPEIPPPPTQHEKRFINCLIKLCG